MDAFYTRVVGLTRVTDLRIEDASAPHRWDDAMRVAALDVLLDITGTQVEVRHYQGPGAPMAFELLKYHGRPAGSVERTITSPLGLTRSLQIAMPITPPKARKTLKPRSPVSK